MPELDYGAAKEKLRREAEAPTSEKKRASRRFVNEIGNRISVIVEETTDTGTTESTGKKAKFDAVRLVVTGPTSTSENTLTRQEAIELMSCLERVLK
jgi:hypothetical protein